MQCVREPFCKAAIVVLLSGLTVLLFGFLLQHVQDSVKKAATITVIMIGRVLGLLFGFVLLVRR